MATIQEFIIGLENRVKNLKTFTDPLKIAAFSATAEMGQRIFDDGRKEDGSLMGHYNVKPIYVSLNATPKPKGAPTGKPSGKTRKKKITRFASETSSELVTTTVETLMAGKSKFKNGKRHKSKYFEKGYREYRENVGRQTAFVDLSMTGELRMDFSNDKKAAEPVKINEFEYQIRIDKDINQKKVGGQEERYGDIFTPSAKEKELFFSVIQKEFNKRITNKPNN